MIDKEFYNGYCVNTTHTENKETNRKHYQKLVNKQLKEEWDKVCDRYLATFCEKHDYTYEPVAWVGSDPGTIADVSDMFIKMDDIRYDIDNDVPEEYFSKWYWKSVELHELGVDNYMNYPSYCKGAPDIWTEEKIEGLRKAHQRVEETKRQLEKLLEEYKNDKKLF